MRLLWSSIALIFSASARRRLRISSSLLHFSSSSSDTLDKSSAGAAPQLSAATLAMVAARQPGALAEPPRAPGAAPPPPPGERASPEPAGCPQLQRWAGGNEGDLFWPQAADPGKKEEKEEERVWRKPGHRLGSKLPPSRRRKKKIRKKDLDKKIPETSLALATGQRQLRAPAPRRKAKDARWLSRYPPPPGCGMQGRMRNADAAHHGGGQSGPGGGGAGTSGNERERAAGMNGKEGAERALPAPVAGAGPLAAFQRGARHVRAGAARAPRGSRAPPAGRSPPARPGPSRGGRRDGRTRPRHGHTRGTDTHTCGSAPALPAGDGRAPADGGTNAATGASSGAAGGGHTHYITGGQRRPGSAQLAPSLGQLLTPAGGRMS